MLQISQNLFLFEDTCNVYVLRNGQKAVLIDFGDGDVLDALAAVGVEQVAAVLMTHHHRDQGQGLPKAAAAHIPIWVPHSEQELFYDVDSHWQARQLYNNYDVRQDRFSLLESVPISGTLQDYQTYSFGGLAFTIIPTPGHTLGSITLLTELDGQRAAFTGDLIAGPGKVWSLAATQWSYNKAEGVAASIPSLLELKERRPDLLLPSHGEVIADPPPAIDLLVSRLRELLDERGENPRMYQFLKQPYEAITPHLLRNLTSLANSYVLLSESGKALVFDYGYDFLTGISAGSDRTSRRPWLYTIPHLKRDYGVTRIDAVIPTHFHDDHVAGLNLLRRIEHAEVWAAENFADILEHPSRYDLPCLWYDPITVDRRLPLGEAIRWEEYVLTLYPLSGHTEYAVAIAFEVDNTRVLVTGDQYERDTGDGFNYVYKNDFHISDYVQSAALYRELAPQLILSGHWNPLWVEPGYFDCLEARGSALERLHRELLPLESVDFEAQGVGVSIQPYQIEARAGENVSYQVEVRNPFRVASSATVRLITPTAWALGPSEQHITLAPLEVNTVTFTLTLPAGIRQRRARIAVDLTVGGKRFGQQAEALITVQ